MYGRHENELGGDVGQIAKDAENVEDGHFCYSEEYSRRLESLAKQIVDINPQEAVPLILVLLCWNLVAWIRWVKGNASSSSLIPSASLGLAPKTC